MSDYLHSTACKNKLLAFMSASHAKKKKLSSVMKLYGTADP